MKHLMTITAISATLMAGTPVLVAHYTGSASRGVSGKSLAFAQALNITPQAADAIALAKIGGGSVVKTSIDTYQGAKVYDIHLVFRAKTWDVKIVVTTGSVVLARLAQEQPPAQSTATSNPPKPSSSDTSGASQPSSDSTSQSLSTPGTSSNPPTSTVQASTSPAPQQISIAVAGSLAIQAVGGGIVQHTSNDSYQGTRVYDIHVLFNGVVYDVKVSQSAGTVLLKKISQESQASHSTSSNGASQDSQDAPDKPSPSPTPAPVPTGGLVFNQKLSAAPAAYQGDVSQAIAQVGGGTLKWVKFMTKSSGNIEMNIKIRLNTKGTIKVKDVLSPTGQLLSQSLNS